MTKVIVLFFVLSFCSISHAQVNDTLKNIFPTTGNQIVMLVTLEKIIGVVDGACEFNSKQQYYLYKARVDSILVIQDTENAKELELLSRERPYFLVESEVTGSQFIVFAWASYYEYFMVNRFYPAQQYRKYYFNRSSLDVITGSAPCRHLSRKQKFFAHFVWTKKGRERLIKKIKDLPKEEHKTWRLVQEGLRAQ